MAKQTVVVQDYLGQGVIRQMPKSNNYFMRFKVKAQKGWTAWRTTKTDVFDDAAKVAATEYKSIVERVEGAERGSIDLAKVYDDFTFVGVGRQWLEEYKRCAENSLKPAGSSKKASLKQVPDHTKHVDRYIQEFFGDHCKGVLISRVTEDLLKDYIQWRRTYYTEGPGKDIEFLEVERNGKAYKHRVKHKEMELPSGTMGTINAIFEFALRKGIVAANQRPDVPSPTKDFRDKKKSRRPAFSSEHWKKLVAGMDDYIADAPRDKETRARENLRYYILIMAEMGIRPGKEHSQLQWKHVDFETDLETGMETALVTIHENTKGGSRLVVVAPHGTKLLRNLLAWTEYGNDEDYIFANTVSGSPLLRFDASFNKLLSFLEITHAANGRKYAPYSLRHTYATRSREAGLPDHIIAMNMGHENETMVQQIYGQDEITAHKETIIQADKKRNPSAHKSTAKDYLIKTVIDVRQDSDLFLEEDDGKLPRLKTDGDKIVIDQ